MIHKEQVFMSDRDDNDFFDGRYYIWSSELVYQQIYNLKQVNPQFDIGEIDCRKGRIRVYRHNDRYRKGVWFIDSGGLYRHVR